MQFRVGDLPKQKITDSRFATRANEKVRIGQVRRREVLLELAFRDGAGDLPVMAIVQDLIDGIEDFRSASITEGDG